MSYAVKLVYGAEYVLLEYSGRVTRDIQEAGRTEAIRALSDNGWCRLLADARWIDPAISVTDDFEFTAGHRSTHPPLVRIAVLYHPDQSERFQFIENVAMNRGLNLKIFTDAAEAINWLSDN